jgi:hypothetical protein
MELYATYLRTEAEKYREEAKREGDLATARECDELALICDKAANEIEDRLPAG